MRPTRPLPPAPRAVRASALAAALSATLLAACDGARDPLAALPPDDPVAAFVAPPALLDALGDAESRLAAAVAAPSGDPLAPALGELRAAVAAGQARRADAALRAVRARLATHAPAAADAADLAALALTTDLVAATLQRPEEAR